MFKIIQQTFCKYTVLRLVSTHRYNLRLWHQKRKNTIKILAKYMQIENFFYKTFVIDFRIDL